METKIYEINILHLLQSQLIVLWPEIRESEYYITVNELLLRLMRLLIDELLNEVKQYV